MTLILDHINGTNTDDRLENLRWVCPNCNQQLETTCGSAIRKYERKYCLDCGKEIHHLSDRCKECYVKYRKEHVGSTIPVPREELKKLIRDTPFTQLGQRFGVSDKAITKWCLTYDLPNRRKDIKQYNDIDWENL